MKNKQFKFSQNIRNMYSAVEYDLKSYQSVLSKINNIKLDTMTNEQLKHKALELKQKVMQGVPLDNLLVDAYGLVREASRRVLHLYPYDVQVIAAIAIHQGSLVEMQVGEGKTLTAVMPAFLNALTGEGVHVLTFNDYLASRDAKWMAPVYEFLGLKVGFVKEGMSIKERRAAYQADITYVTAKEAGFDYLRDSLCIDNEELVQRELKFAIIDEADSILIDEARIPLVIAGNVSENLKQYIHLSKLVRSFTAGSDYELDQYEDNVYLTEQGLNKAEAILDCGNLYENENLELLTALNCALFAEVLLKRDRDYIVREGKLEIVDEFTGRIADKRQWTNNLHAAVEAKEGVAASSKGNILGSIALQHFISIYTKISGMTGTAKSAAKELREFYNLSVLAIPTNKPCIRKNHGDYIYINKLEKYRAIVSEVVRVHKKGQPVLLGTSSVEESEQLAEMLKAQLIECNVLNAKNDEEEAQIIAKAGELGAVTVSTNMAGRGVDIKLGGVDEKDRDKVIALGGLYIIGTNHHESRRIDDQLKGRAGRQGEPGESRFFISLEDEFIKRFEVLKIFHLDLSTMKQEELQKSSKIRNAIERGQRIVEGYNSDLRIQQWKYSFILEQQRRIIHKWRQDILADRELLGLLSKEAETTYTTLELKYGAELLRRVEKQLTLYYINKHWADYLDYMSYMRESIHLVVIGRQNPLFEFNKLAVQAFDEMLKDIERDIVSTFEAASITKAGIDMEKEGLKTPSSTWTYLIDENPDQFRNLSFLSDAISNAVKGPLFTLRSLYRFFANKAKTRIK